MTDNSFKTDKLNKITLEETSNNDKITKLDQLINKLQPTVNNNRITEILNRLKSRQKHDLLEEYDDIIKRMNNNKTKNTSTNTFLQIWKLFFNNQPESPLGNLIPLYVLKKEYNLLNNNDEMNLEQLSTLIKLRPYYQRISSICREFFERPKYTDENKPLEFTFNLMQFLTKIYISNGIHNLMRYTILQYLIQTQPTTKLGDVLIILQNIFKQEYVWRGRRGTLDEILNNQVSKLLVQNIKNIHPDVNQEFNAKMISANDIISNVFGLLVQSPHPINESIIESKLQDELTNYLGTISNFIINEWYALIQNTFRFFINQHRKLEVLLGFFSILNE